MIGFSQWASCKILITQTIEIIHEACVNNDMIEAMRLSMHMPTINI